MAPVLSGYFPTQPPESSHNFARSEYGNRRHQAGISSSRVVTVRGIPRSARTSRHCWIASRMLFSASSSVFPWLTHPGIEGHSAMNMPSSSRTIVTINFIKLHDKSSAKSIPYRHQPSNAVGRDDGRLCSGRVAGSAAKCCRMHLVQMISIRFRPKTSGNRWPSRRFRAGAAVMPPDRGDRTSG